MKKPALINSLTWGLFGPRSTIEQTVNELNGGAQYLRFDYDTICVDGHFTPEQLVQIAAWKLRLDE